MNTQSRTTCTNPACRKPIARRDALLRSISLKQVAFCSQACIDVFTGLDQAARAGVPGHRRVVVPAPHLQKR